MVGSSVDRRRTISRTCWSGWRAVLCAAADWWQKPAGERVDAFRNTSAHAGGSTARAPTLYRMPIADMNEDVLLALEKHALTAEAIEPVFLLSERDGYREREEALQRDQKNVGSRSRGWSR